VSLPVVVRPAARAELAEAVEWHERRRAGRGDVFTAAVEGVFDEITANPLLYAEVYDDIREAPVPGFRYCVYYRPHPDRIEVIAVFHTSRDPSVWQRRS
jgi:plasmid stabilization system protein ParE